MLKYLNLFILLLSGFSTKCSSEDTTQWRRKTKEITFREDYTFIEAEESFYKYHDVEVTWHAAVEACAQEGASLFYPETKKEADTVISFWRQNDKNTSAGWVAVYVGISDIEIEGVFVTIDGRSIDEVYSKWRKGQPDNYRGNEDCLMMYLEADYNDIHCTAKYRFICKKTLKSLTKSTTKRTTRRSNFYDIFSNNSFAYDMNMFVFWPNATVPYYINPDHFDTEQTTVILKSLRMFKLNTCIKFAPVMSPPGEGQHVMTFINPDGVRRCKIETKGHSNYNPHLIQLGYDCLNTREIDMIIMRALGFPFEHNRPNRDSYIDVLIQNVEPSYIQLFTKESILPTLLRLVPYDYYSIMHFGERDYSKNGHRTIKFKVRSFSQARNGLTAADIKRIGLTASDKKKIALVYGPQCKIRDRAEKIAICKNYPGATRRKREIIEPPENMNLSFDQ